MIGADESVATSSQRKVAQVLRGRPRRRRLAAFSSSRTKAPCFAEDTYFFNRIKSQRATLIGEAGTGVLRQTPSRRFASIMLPINGFKNRGKAKLSFAESNR